MNTKVTAEESDYFVTYTNLILFKFKVFSRFQSIFSISVTDCYLFCFCLLVFTFRLMSLACKLRPLSFVKISSFCILFFLFYSCNYVLCLIKFLKYKKKKLRAKNRRRAQVNAGAIFPFVSKRCKLSDTFSLSSKFFFYEKEKCKLHVITQNRTRNFWHASIILSPLHHHADPSNSRKI